MRSLRFRSSTASTSFAAAATALVASLALTACGPSDEVNSKPQGSATVSATDTATDEPAAGANDEKPSTEPTANSAGTDAADKGNGGSDSGKGSPDQAGSGKGTGGKGDASTDSRAACEGSTTNVTVTEVSRPINHLLVTATNTGDKNCDAYYAPLLGFDDAQSTTQINEDSKPQAVVTLAPGQSAYASISLGGADGSPTTDVSELTVHFAGRANEGSVGESSGPITLPAGTGIADSASVTYWQSTMDLALTW